MELREYCGLRLFFFFLSFFLLSEGRGKSKGNRGPRGKEKEEDIYRCIPVSTKAEANRV